MNIRATLAASAAALLLCGGCFGERASYPELIAKAEKYAVAGEWEKALEYSRRAVAKEPSNVRALVLNALACENNGRQNDALDEISKAAAIAPDSYFVQYTRGRLLFERGRYESCIAPLKDALKARPDSSDCLVLLAEVSVKQRNIRDAQAYYGRLAKTPAFAKDPAPWSEIGMNYLIDYKDPAKAYPYFSYAYNLAKSNPTAVLNMAVMMDKYYRRGSDAKAYYLRYLSLTQQDSSLAGERAEVESRIRALR